MPAPPRTRPAGPAVLGSVTPEPVEVRRAFDGAGPPSQFLWRGSLWLVREALPDPGPAPEPCSWRVRAGQGPGRSQDAFWVWRDVAGRWWLRRAPR